MKKYFVIAAAIVGVAFGAQADDRVTYDKSCDNQRANITVNPAGSTDVKVTNYSKSTAVKATETRNDGAKVETRIAPEGTGNIKGANDHIKINLECSSAEK